MAYSVTSWFLEQCALKSSTPKRVFTLAGSDYSARVLRWPTISREWNSIRPVSLNLALANEDGNLNIFRASPWLMRGTGLVKIGFTHPSSGDELITMYEGTLERVKYSGGACELQFLDKMKEFTERVLGSSDAPLTYTGSNYLPSDIAWWLCTSYGGKSSVASTSNPDIDYASFSAWAAIFSGDAVLVQANFPGTKLNEALKKIGRYTDSGIFVEGGKITFARFAVTNSLYTNLDSNHIKKLELAMDDTSVNNKQHVYANYSVGSRYWQIDAVSVVSASVNSYGLREFVEKDESVWYVNSASAVNLAQRRTSFESSPIEDYMVDTTLVALPRQLGETVYLADPHLSVLSGTGWRVMKYDLDLNTGQMKLNVNNARLQRPFTLDDATLGLLDQTYNYLL